LIALGLVIAVIVRLRLTLSRLGVIFIAIGVGLVRVVIGAGLVFSLVLGSVRFVLGVIVIVLVPGLATLLGYLRSLSAIEALACRIIVG
jgi:hypothetical protein